MPEAPSSPEPPLVFSRRAARITLGVLLTAALAMCVLILRPFAGPMVTGAVMAVAFYPLHRRIKQRVKRPSAAALLSTLLVAIAVLGPISYVITMVVGELRAAYQALGPGGVGAGANRLWEVLEGPLDAAGGWFGMTGADLRAAAILRLRDAGGSLLSQGVSLIGTLTGGVINTFVVVGTLFFGLLYGGRIREQILVYSPLGLRRTDHLLKSAIEMIEASFYGVIAVAVAQGALVAAGVWVAGLGSPALWGLVGAAGSVIPFVGSSLAWLPAAGLLFLQGSVGWGLFMLIWGVAVVGMVDNVIRPLVLAARRPISPLLIFVVILGGLQAFGVIGILLGPVTLAVTLALLRILREEMGTLPE